MSLDLFYKIARDIFSLPVLPSVKLSLNGEPLLDNGLVEKIKHLKSLGNIRLSLNTNASLLDDKLSSELIMSGLDRINFHVSGFSPQTYNEIMVGLNFDSTMAKVANFVSLAKTLGSKIWIAVKFVMLNKNIHELRRAERYYKSLGILFRPDFLDSRLDACKQYDKLVTDNAVQRENPMCPLIFEQMFVRHNGDVVSCWSDWHGERKFGNLNSTTLLDIYNSDRFRELRSLHLSGHKGADTLCSKCMWIDKEKYGI